MSHVAETSTEVRVPSITSINQQAPICLQYQYIFMYKIKEVPIGSELVISLIFQACFSIPHTRVLCIRSFHSEWANTLHFHIGLTCKELQRVDCAEAAHSLFVCLEIEPRMFFHKLFEGSVYNRLDLSSYCAGSYKSSFAIVLS